MPKGYLVGHFILLDRDRFMDKYASKVGAIFEEFGGKYLVRGGEVSYREGEHIGDRHVIVQFPDKEAVQRCLRSESYKNIAAGRTANSTGMLIVVDGV